MAPLLAAFVACDGGAPADVDGGAGSDAGGADGSDSGGSDSGGGGASGGAAGGASGGSGGSEVSIDLAEYCELRSERYFDYLSTCYGNEDFPESYREEYVAQNEARCMNAERAIEEGRLTYDGVLGAACVAALEEVDCVTYANDAICGDVFEGQSEPGDDCYVEETLIFFVGVSTCQDGYCAGEECPGTCTTLPGPGEDCEGPCQEGYYCDQELQCQPLPMIGDPCPDSTCAPGAGCSEGTCVEVTTSSAEACGEEVLCGGPTVCDEGTCRWRVEVGDPCTRPFHCPSPATCREQTCQLPGDEGSDCGADADCTEGLYCPPLDEAAVCTPFAGLGGLCAGEAAVKCAPEHACVQAPEELEARCRERVPEGESCADGYQLCKDGVYCNAEAICAPPGSEGDGCWAVHPCEEGLGCHCAAENTDDCATSQQDDGDTCQPLLGNGEPCFNHQECDSGECDFSVSGAPAEPGVCFTSSSMLCLP